MGTKSVRPWYMAGCLCRSFCLGDVAAVNVVVGDGDGVIAVLAYQCGGVDLVSSTLVLFSL